MSNKGGDKMKYATLRVKLDTHERVLLYQARRMMDDKKKLIIDDMINDSLDALEIINKIRYDLTASCNRNYSTKKVMRFLDERYEVNKGEMLTLLCGGERAK